MDRQARRVERESPNGSETSPEVCGKVSDKVFFRASRGTRRLYVSGLAIEAVVPSDFAASVRKRCSAVSPHVQALLEQLLLVGGDDNYTAVLPADDHPQRRLRVWRCFYELEMDTAQTYASRFFGDAHFYPVQGYPLVRPGDDLVIIGSQVSNSSARALLGKAQRQDPLFHIEHGGWCTELHWNLVTPGDAPLITIREFGGYRASAAHVIWERGNPVPYQSRRDAAKTRYVDDYLLVTTLPLAKGGRQRALIFSGLHGPGSRAVDLILREPPVGLLEEAARQIAGAPYFQMMIHVDTEPDEQGESFPRGLELVAACALTAG